MNLRENINGVVYKEFIKESAEDLYEHSPCGYISTLPDGTIVKINQTLLKWLGFTQDEILYVRKFQYLLSIGGKIFYETHQAPLLQMQGFINEINYDFVRKDCSSFPALINSVLIKDKEGKPLLNRTTVFNISDRKKYELELLQAKKKAEEASRVKAEFLSTISHEIRTPMNAVIGIADILIGTEPRPEQMEFLNILKFSAEHLLNLVNDILDFSKIESGKIMLEEKVFNIKDLIYSIVYSLGIKAEEKGLLIHSRIDKKLPALLVGDPVKMSQIITNLVGNAVKFTEKGSVTIHLLVREQTEQHVSIDFSVTDTGIGIPLEKQEQIFEEFRQASYDINQKYGGTGLGLSISRKLLDLYGSKLKVKSEAGKGSIFYFNLKLGLSQKQLQPGLSAPIESNSEAGVESINGVKLLVAEDNEVNVLVLSQFLNKWGVEFDVASNGIQAVEKVIDNNYDLVLMDLQMPEMDGYEACTKIRSIEGDKYQTLPVIALSAFSRSHVENNMKVAGIQDFVSKPFNPKELFAKIAAYTLPGNKNIAKPKRSAIELIGSSSVPLITESPVINLSQYRTIAGDSKKDLIQLVELSIRDFIHLKNESMNALHARNIGLLEKLIHKNKTAIALLEANQLNALVWQGIHLLQQQSDDQSILDLNKILNQELDTIISHLKAAC